MENLIAIIIAPVSTIAGVWLTRAYDMKKYKMELSERKQARDFDIGKEILPDVLNCTKKVYSFIMDLNADFPVDEHHDSEHYESVLKKLREMRVWLNENIVFLPGNIRQDFRFLVNLAPIQKEMPSAQFWEKIPATITKIQNGIDQFIDRYSLLSMK